MLKISIPLDCFISEDKSVKSQHLFDIIDITFVEMQRLFLMFIAQPKYEGSFTQWDMSRISFTIQATQVDVDEDSDDVIELDIPEYIDTINLDFGYTHDDGFIFDIHSKHLGVNSKLMSHGGFSFDECRNKLKQFCIRYEKDRYGKSTPWNDGIMT